MRVESREEEDNQQHLFIYFFLSFFSSRPPPPPSLMSTTVNLDFYDSGTDLAAQAAAYGTAPAPAAPALLQPSYPMAPPAYTAPTQFATPTYNLGPGATYGGAMGGNYGGPTTSLGSMEGGAGLPTSSLGFDEEPPLLEGEGGEESGAEGGREK